MKLNICIFCIMVILYILVIIMTVIKIKDIRSNPKKYEHNDLINETNKKYVNKWDKFSGFYKSLSHQYGMVTILFLLSFIVLGTIFIFSINKLFTNGEGDILLGTQLIGTIGLLFLGIPLCTCIIPLSIKRPFFVVVTLDMFNTDYRPNIYFKSYLMFLIIFIITFPFFTFSCDNYAYYDSNGIYYNKYFQIEEDYFSYEEISKVEISPSYDEGKISELNYIVYMDGDKLDINSPNISKKTFSKDTLEIHNYILNTGNTLFEVTKLTEEELKYLEEKVSYKDYLNIVNVFNVNE